MPDAAFSYRSPRQLALCRVEVVLVVGLVAAFGTVLAPMVGGYFGPKEKSLRDNCLCQQKQIALALLAYAQDNDERFPPGVGAWRSPRTGRVHPSRWGVEGSVADHPGGVERVPALIGPYRKSPQSGIIYPPVCPAAARESPEARLTYMYNDLAATARRDEIATPYRSVLFAEGEDLLDNVGHAWEPRRGPYGARFDARGVCPPGGGATVRDAPRRHSGGLGSNYAFTDGHVKWLRPEYVFFPPRASASRTHRDAAGRVLGPDPAEEEGHGQGMRFRGVAYAATFHLR